MPSYSHILCLLLLVTGFGVPGAAVQTSSTPETLTLSNTLVELELNAADFTMKQLRDPVAGRNYVQTPEGALFLLAELVPGEAPPAWYAVPAGKQLRQGDFTDFEAISHTADGRSGWRLRFSGHPQTDVTVEISVTLAEDSPLLAWGIRIENRSTVPLQSLYFPLIHGLASDLPGSAETDYLALPVMSGRKYAHPRQSDIAAPGMSDYPGGGMTIQLVSYCDGGDGTLYYATHDADNHRKIFCNNAAADKQSFQIGSIHFPDRPYAPGTWELPYPVMCGPIAGDWYDAAKLYRSWAVQQPRWFRSLAQRDDIPTWFRKLPVWFQGNQWNGGAAAMEKFADQIVTLREALGYDFGFHWYIWQKYLAHDYAYPDYLPARPGFAEAAAKVQNAGVRVVPYLNIHLCETTLPIWTERNLSDAAKRDSRGELYRSYGVGGNIGTVTNTQGPVDVFRSAETAGRDMVPMCPGETVWEQLILDIAGELANSYHIDGIYYDETYVFAGLCYAGNHRHPWIGGSYHADGVTEIHRATAALQPGELLTAGENLGESYIDSCMALFNGHSDMRADSLPIFQTVHSDRTTEIGVWASVEEMKSPEIFVSKLSFGLLRGRQLGWLYSDQGSLLLAEPEYRTQLELLRRYCDIRQAGLPWLYAGEMLRAPDLSQLSTISQRWSIWPGQERADYTFPVVTGAAYRGQDSTIGLILTNLTDVPQHVQIPWNAKDWDIEIGRPVLRADYVDGAWNESAAFALPLTLSAELTTYQPLIIRITPAGK